MIKSSNRLIIALIIPVLILGLICAKKQYDLTHGAEVTLPISGYDPRDILSGHYLVYQIDFNIPNLCATLAIPGYVCINPRVFSAAPIKGCRLIIKGNCRGGRFETGAEKFYIPENRAAELNAKILTHSAAIVLSVTADGTARAKDLLIDGISWKKSASARR